LYNTKERDMSAYELQILETERRYDQLIRQIEKEDPNVLHSVVPGSRLHEIIHNPVTEGIDEG
jgi:hypothetical protein